MKFKNAYRIAISGMRNGRCQRTHEYFDVGARNEKEAIEVLKKAYDKTAKYSVRFQHPTDLGIPIGRFVQKG